MVDVSTSNLQLSQLREVVSSSKLGENGYETLSSLGFHPDGATGSLWELGVGGWELAVGSCPAPDADNPIVAANAGQRGEARSIGPYGPPTRIIIRNGWCCPASEAR